MSSKRKGDSSTLKRSKKVPKLDNKQVDTPKVSPAKLQELKLALNQNVCNSQVLQLIQEIVSNTALDQCLSMDILQFSIRIKNVNVARQVLMRQSVDLNTREGGMLLEAALNAGNADIAKLLLEFNADVNICDPQDNSTLLHKVLNNYKIENTEELIQLMLKYGAKVNVVNREGCSVLHEVIMHKRCSTNLVIELLKLGANITVNQGNRDDLFWASCYKPELLPRLVQHKVQDEQTRDQRGVMAINYLIRSKNAGTLRIMKEILDLGVKVNTGIPNIHGRGPCSLLSAALWAKNKDVIALLVQYGANVHEKDEYGHTPLYQAMRFKGYTNSTRLLLESGAKIDEKNTNGRYPIHGACENDSLRNVHLLLNLGADINVMDNEGHTPFKSLDISLQTSNFSDAGRLVIKHFALLISQGEEISETDMNRVNLYILGRFHYQKCTEELEKMKVTNICDGVSYFALLSENINSKMRLMKNPDFSKNLNRNCKNLIGLFPIYRYMLLHSFEIAKLQFEIFLEYSDALQASLELIVPILVIDKIASYLPFIILPVLKRCHDDFYMALHKSLKNNQTDKEKIL